MNTMNILIIGSGGREHALGWKIRQSPRCGQLYFAPGNGGTAELGENVDLPVDTVNTKNADAIDWFCRENNVSLVVIGPEDPLSEGLADRLQREGRYIFGPVQAAARLEADKAWAKQFMKSVSIPTADSRVFHDLERACHYIENHEEQLVVKATGLAKGKGVFVCRNQQQAIDATRACLQDRVFGDAGATVLIEERLQGQELSVLALVDGRNIYVLDPTQDHKQIFEGDTGPNTGGMGAYCPTPLVTDELMHEIEKEILVPIVDAMQRESIPYHGVLYAGLMLTAAGPKVLEFNCRFGDPETQPLMMRLQGDLIEIIIATCEGHLDEVDLGWDPRIACGVVMSSGGYPGDFEKNKTITGIEEAQRDPDVKVFHAGTRLDREGKLVTSGGRVLCVVALGHTLQEAQQKANAACDKIRFDGAYFRRDIGHRVMHLI